jgi:hypothetical protein
MECSSGPATLDQVRAAAILVAAGAAAALALGTLVTVRGQAIDIAAEVVLVLALLALARAAFRLVDQSDGRRRVRKR